MIGYTRQEVEELFQNRFAEMVIDNVPEILKNIAHTIEQGKNLDYEYRMRRKDGSVMWIHDTAAYDKETNTFYVTIMDITEKKTIQYQMQKLLAILDHIPNKIVIADLKKRIEYQNIAWKNEGYHKKEAIIPLDLEALIGNSIIGQSFQDLWLQSLCGRIVQYETRVKSKDMILSHDKNYLIPIMDQRSEIVNIMQVSEDLMKQNDALTRVPNRGMFEHYYNEQKQLAFGAFHMALIIIDIDDFKIINDNYGHAGGDFIIQKVAKFLVDLLRDKDYVSRYGGDEFIFLLEIDEEGRLDKYLERLMAFTREEILWKNELIHVTYSIGVSLTHGQKVDYHTLFQNADIALYEAKRSGKNHYVIYQESMIKTKLFKRYYAQYMQEYLEREDGIFFLQPYKGYDLEEDILKVVYRREVLQENLRELLMEKRTDCEWYIDEEIFHMILQKILIQFSEYKKEKPNAKLCMSLFIQFVMEKEFFYSLEKIMKEYQHLTKDIIFKIIGEKSEFQTEKIQKLYYNFTKKGYEVIIGDFGNQITSYEVLLELPTKYISVDAGFLEHTNQEKGYQIIWNMLLQISETYNRQLLFNEME